MVEIRVLSKAVIEAQQALSEKFGIPTFGLRGELSTIPQSRPLNESINVNTGASGLSVSAFNDLIRRFSPPKPLVPLEERFTPQAGFFEAPKGTPLEPGEVILPTGPTIFSSIAPYSGYLVLGAVALLALGLVKRI